MTQEANGSAAGCGQDTASREEPATGCAQGPAAGATGRGQEAVERATGCGQAVENAAGCGQERGGACGPEGRRHLDQVEMRAWRAFLTASTAVTAHLNQELIASVGISMHEYEILVRLAEAPGSRLRMAVLAQNVAHSRSRLTHTVGRLEKEGYVVREACADDGRGVFCVLTPSGRGFLRRAAPIHLDGVRRHVVDRVGRERLDVFTELLENLVDPADPA